MTQIAKSSSAERTVVAALFAGKKEKWIPLYRRLAARFSRIPGVEIEVTHSFLLLTLISGTRTKARKRFIGRIQVKTTGLSVGLGLPSHVLKSKRLVTFEKPPKRITHTVLITEASQIDEDFLNWVNAAIHQVRTAKRRTT